MTGRITLLLVGSKALSLKDRLRERTLPHLRIITESPTENDLRDTQHPILMGDGETISAMQPQLRRFAWVHCINELGHFRIQSKRKLSRFTETPTLTIDGLRDHVLGWILADARDLFKLRDQQLNRVWEKQHGNNLKGKTIAIVGMTELGLSIIQATQALQMRTIVFSETGVAQDDAIDEADTVTQFQDIAKNIDYLILCDDPDLNRTIITQENISHMKDDTYIIDTGYSDLSTRALILNLPEGQRRKIVFILDKSDYPQIGDRENLNKDVHIYPREPKALTDEYILDLFQDLYLQFLRQRQVM